MRLDELVTLGDVLKASQYVKLLRTLKVHAKDDIKADRIKNKIMQDWKSGMKSRKHFDSLLGQINLNLNDLISK